MLIGRTLADLVRNVFVVALMALVGVAVGWDPTGNPLAILAGLGLVLGFAYSLSWVFAIVGLSAKDGETAQAASFPILAPLVFASSAFVPVSSMPSWLQVFAKHQPVTAVVDAVRALTITGTGGTHLLDALLWIGGIIAVCAPLAVRPVPARHLATPRPWIRHPRRTRAATTWPTPATATADASSCCGSSALVAVNIIGSQVGSNYSQSFSCPAPSRSGRSTCSRPGSPRRPATPVRSSSLTPPASATRRSRPG